MRFRREPYKKYNIKKLNKEKQDHLEYCKERMQRATLSYNTYHRKKYKRKVPFKIEFVGERPCKFICIGCNTPKIRNEKTIFVYLRQPLLRRFKSAYFLGAVCSQECYMLYMLQVT